LTGDEICKCRHPHGGREGQPDADKEEGRVKNYQIFANVLYGWPLTGELLLLPSKINLFLVET